MGNILKITSADYPDLLAAVDAGTTQRELARRYGCAPSLVARHLTRARQAGEPSEPARGPGLGLSADPHNGSMREILEARIHDPRTSARDLASLANTLARLEEEDQRPEQSGILSLRRATLILEPGLNHRLRLMMRVQGGIEHLSGTQYDLTPTDALYLLACVLQGAMTAWGDDRGTSPDHPEPEPASAESRGAVSA